MIAEIKVRLTNEEKTILLKSISLFDEIEEKFKNIDNGISCDASKIASDIADIVDTFANYFEVDFNSNERS